MLLRENSIFFKLWLANLFAQFGVIFYEVVIVWYLVEATGSALLAAGIPVATMMGYMIGSAAGSKHIDRLPTKKIMVVAESFRLGILIVILSFQSILTEHVTVLYVVSFVLAIFALLHGIAHAKTIPETVREEQLTAANGLGGVSASIVRIAAWGLGGLFITNLTLANALLVPLSASLLALVLVLSSKWTYSLSDRAEKESGLSEGLAYIKKSPTIKRMVYSETLFYLLMGFLWVALPFKIANLGDGMLYGLQGMFFGFGYLLTSLLLARKTDNKKAETIFLVGFGFYMVGNIFMTFAFSGAVLLFGLLISGLAVSYWVTGRSTLFHLKIPTSEIGKVFSVTELSASLAQIPGYLIGGMLVDHFGFIWVMGVVTVLQFGCLLWVCKIRKSND